MPTVPKLDPPPAESTGDELATLPHSLAPMSAPTAEESDEPAPEPVWHALWRRRWFVGGASAAAFVGALIIGRLAAVSHATKTPPLDALSAQPLRTSSAAAMTAQVDEPVVVAPRPAEAPATDVPAAAATANVTDALVITTQSTETRSSSGAASGSKPRARRSAPAASATPHKRFVPTQI